MGNDTYDFVQNSGNTTYDFVQKMQIIDLRFYAKYGIIDLRFYAEIQIMRLRFFCRGRQNAGKENLHRAFEMEKKKAAGKSKKMSYR